MYCAGSVVPLATSLSRTDHTWGPATASTDSLFWSWRAITAPFVMGLEDPSVHSEVRELGSPAHRQVKPPAWGIAACAGGGAGPLGAKLSGR